MDKFQMDCMSRPITYSSCVQGVMYNMQFAENKTVLSSNILKCDIDMGQNVTVLPFLCVLKTQIKDYILRKRLVRLLHFHFRHKKAPERCRDICSGSLVSTGESSRFPRRSRRLCMVSLSLFVCLSVCLSVCLLGTSLKTTDRMSVKILPEL